MRPLERLLLSTTPKAWETRPSAVAHSLVISPALATPLWGIMLSSATTETLGSPTYPTTVHLAFALADNSTGHYNSVLGTFALQFNTTGEANTATGYGALQGNTTGNFNTASGFRALISNTTGLQNTATGAAALANNTTGSFNNRLRIVCPR